MSWLPGNQGEAHPFEHSILDVVLQICVGPTSEASWLGLPFTQQMLLQDMNPGLESGQVMLRHAVLTQAG